MKCNHLALAIRGCFSKRGTAALLKSVSEASAARILEQRQSSAWLPGTGTGQGASTGHPYVPSGSLAGAGWLCMGLSATCLPPLSPSVLGQHGKVAAPNCCLPDKERRWASCHHHQTQHTPIQPLKMMGLVHVSTLNHLGGGILSA